MIGNLKRTKNALSEKKVHLMHVAVDYMSLCAGVNR